MAMDQSTRALPTLSTSINNHSNDSTRRSPLAERQPRTRQSSLQSKASDHAKSGHATSIPHHESVHAGGSLPVTSQRDDASSEPVSERVAAIAEYDSQSRKRDSHLSTTSTASSTKVKRKTHIGPWQLGRTLGKGATGRVRLAKHAFTGQTAAIKIVSKKSAAMVQSASMRHMDNDKTVSGNISGARTMPFGIEREIVIMKLIEHPHVVSLYDIWENRGELYLVLEYVEGGELFDYVTRNGALPEGEAVRLLRQLVAGLSYCHRFNICHRDLKPENILLDKDHNIKIADFGMAALQPHGEYLTTSCGSPHYAAPEIIAGRQYQGNLSDLWSVGIILYAMLNGFLPFDGGDLHGTLALVRKGDYYLSPTLSVEAADLIQCILQKRPENRIPMADIWNHPLLRKYENIHARLAAPNELVGPPPPLTAADCGPRRIRPADIDRELLRNLQILWHGLGKEEVVKRLTSDEPNHEKLFYWALIRFREEQLENYLGDPLQHSASDYHHLKQSMPRLPKSSTRSGLHQRRNSQFSIVSDDSLARSVYYKNPGTATSKNTQVSYDPYRASRTPITQAQREGTTIVRCPRSRSSLQQGPSAGLRTAVSGTYQSDRSERLNINAEHLPKPMQQKRATYSTTSSLNSIGSSVHQRTFKKSTSHRRNVLFQHQRQQSSRNNSLSNNHDSKGNHSRPVTRESNQTMSDSRSTPSLPPPQHVAQPRRPASDLDLPNRSVKQVLGKDNAPYVNVELSKICEEAFNRSSISCASEMSQKPLIDSPATTVSTPHALLPKLGQGQNLILTSALRDLLRRRQQIIDTWGSADPATLADVVATLDRRILEEQQRPNSQGSRRSASDPTDNNPYSQKARKSTQSVNGLHPSNLRAVSGPAAHSDNTIRMVTPDPTSPMTRSGLRQSKIAPINSLKGGPAPDRRGYDKRLLVGQFLEPILEDPLRSPKKQHTSLDTKKWSWLGKKATAGSDGFPPIPRAKNVPRNRTSRVDFDTFPALQTPQEEADATEDMDDKKRTWFQKVFKRRDQAFPVDSDHQILATDADETDEVEELLTPVPKRNTRRNARPQSQAESQMSASSATYAEPSQSWFAKFLHLKPASSVLIMHASKAQARREVVKILREWQKFGIRDVTVEKRPTGDLIRARVDTANYLHIRPVQFHATVYTVLERGRQANLSIVKFTQEKGAASSFHRVVNTMKSVLGEAELILTDNEKRKKILKSMKQAGL